MGKKIDAIKQQVQLSPREFFASLLNYYVFNGGHFFKTAYNEQPLYLEYSNDDKGPRVDVLYMMQEKSFPLILFMKKQPDYDSALQITPELLSWLQSVYISETPQKPPKPRRSRVRTTGARQSNQVSPDKMNGKLMNGNNGRTIRNR